MALCSMAQTSAKSSKRSTRPSPASNTAVAPDAREFSALPLIILVLSVLGLGVAGYLTYAHYNQDALVCTVGSCHTVQSSKYAMIGGVPIAIFGACMYVALAALAAARRFRVGPLDFDTATMAAFGIV